MSDNMCEPSAKRMRKSDVLSVKVERLLKVWKQQRDNYKKIMERFDEIVSHSLERLISVYQESDSQTGLDSALKEPDAGLESILEYIHKNEEVFNKTDNRFDVFRAVIFGQTSEANQLSESEVLANKTESLLTELKRKRECEHRIMTDFEINISLKVDRIIGDLNGVEVVPNGGPTDQMRDVGVSLDFGKSGTASHILSQELEATGPLTRNRLFYDDSKRAIEEGVDFFLKIHDLWSTNNDEIIVCKDIIYQSNYRSREIRGILIKNFLSNYSYIKNTINDMRTQNKCRIALFFVIRPTFKLHTINLVNPCVFAFDHMYNGVNYYLFDPLEEEVAPKALPKWLKFVLTQNESGKRVIHRAFGQTSTRSECFEMCLKFIASVLDNKCIPSIDWLPINS